MKNKELEKIKLIAMTSNDLIKKSDVVVCLEGDGYNRLDWSVDIFQRGLAKKIILSGGYDNPPFSVPAVDMFKRLTKKGISRQRVILEKKSQHTYEQAVEIIKMAKEKKWKKIILVASHFHQTRAYLTFLRAMKNAGLKIQIFNAPVHGLSWFDKTSLGLNRMRLLENEIKKIDEYIKKGHLVSFADAITYQKWKEKQK